MSKVVLYKGMSKEDFEKFESHNIPGFLAGLRLALIYAQPSLTGAIDDVRYLIKVELDGDLIVDKSDEVSDMCMSGWKDDLDLRSSVWTAGGSAFGGDKAVYCGVPVEWELVHVIHGDEEWHPLYAAATMD